ESGEGFLQIGEGLRVGVAVNVLQPRVKSVFDGVEGAFELLAAGFLASFVAAFPFGQPPVPGESCRPRRSREIGTLGESGIQSNTMGQDHSGSDSWKASRVSLDSLRVVWELLLTIPDVFAYQCPSPTPSAALTTSWRISP